MNTYNIIIDGEQVASVHHLATAKKLARQLKAAEAGSEVEIDVYTADDSYTLEV